MDRAKAHKRQFKISTKEATSLILRYIRKKVTQQVRAVAGIIIYLLLFQSIVLRIPFIDASTITFGMVMVIIGLTFFMEGLLLGIMPMGEEIGIRLPQKVGVSSILIIAFILGLGATFAEPAISVLKVAGSSILAWEAPLLFLLLNKYAGYLVAAVGVGVGIALVMGMIRFIKGHSLKAYIYIMISLLIGLSTYAYLNPNLRYLLGLAWDCGGVTTGPVTVPLVLALGIGISHVANRGGENTEGGFGVVTLASLAPVIAVIVLGIVMSFKVPLPGPDNAFFSKDNPNSRFLFENEHQMKDYAIGKASYIAQLQMFDGNQDALMDYVADISAHENRIREVFGSKIGFRKWLEENGSEQLKAKNQKLLSSELNDIEANEFAIDSKSAINKLKRNTINALRAIVPLSLFLLAVLYFILKERLVRPDEVVLGLVFAILGMAMFGGGIELGLSKLGDQVGSNLPVSFTAMEYPQDQIVINGFDADNVNTAIMANGETKEFFYYEEHGKILTVPYKAELHDKERQAYRYIPQRGPLFGKHAYSIAGILVVLFFAFVLGYSATLAEPALNALGITVEDISVGAFRKTQLIQSVAFGVGAGIMLGVVKIIWDVPLYWFLLPLYVILLVFTKYSTEEFVNIGWDSAGVTTGPITVPLVLSMGLGIGSQVGVVEGFGILSLASACPIISVLGMGIYVNYKRRIYLTNAEPDKQELAAEDVAL